MITSCPHCNLTLDIPPAHYGQSLACPSCGGKFTVAQPSSDELDKSSGEIERPGWLEQDHANPNLQISFCLGLVGAAILLGAMIPFRDSFGAIFIDRTWVNWAET